MTSGSIDTGDQENGSRSRADWEAAHAELVRFARSRAGEDFREGRLLVRALRSGVHARLGHGTFAEYVERLLGYDARQTTEKLRVAEALEGLPILSHALEVGELNWSAIRELTRVATRETEEEWRAAAQGRTVREVEKLVSGLKPGARPGDRPEANLRRHVLRFEVMGETFALFRDALAKLRRDAGEAIDDDAALLMMARAVLQGPKDEGRSNYQIAVGVCELCGRAEQFGKGEAVEIAPEIVAMCRCDAQHVGSVGDQGCVESTHVGTSDDAPERAVQTTRPAVRRWVFRRDRGRCVVPGCRNATFLDIHHIDPQHDGGGHGADNLACLCAAHHRAIHRGRLVVRGRPSTGLVFEHADGTRYGGAVSARKADMVSKVFGALVRLGFRETDSRRAIEQALEPDGEALQTEELFRRAVLALTERATA